MNVKGIIFDLNLMLSAYDIDARLENISLAQHDIPEIFFVSQKLYDRTMHYEILHSIFEKVCIDNLLELVLFSGKSGTVSIIPLQYVLLTLNHFLQGKSYLVVSSYVVI